MKGLMNTKESVVGIDILKDKSIFEREEKAAEIKFRRLGNVLSTSGFGVLMFGLWSIIRTLLQSFFGSNGISEAADEAAGTAAEVPDSLSGVVLVFIIVLAAFVAAEVGARIYVGISARSDSKGKKKSIAYLIVAGILIAFSAVNLVFNIFTLNYQNSFVFDTIITLILDGSSLIVLIELFVTGIRFRKMRKNMKAHKDLI